MERIFTTVLDMSASSAIVILAVIAVRFVLGLCGAPKKWSFVLWTAAAFRLICPVSFKAAFSIFSIGTVNAPAAISERMPAAGTAQVMTGGETAAEAAAPAAAAAAAPMTEAAQSYNALFVFLAVWLIGVTVMLLYAVISYARLRGRMNTAVLQEENIYASEAASSPFILGFVRPRIYVPFGLTGDTRRYVLEHERYHIRRGDHIIKSAAFLILALHWFNPLVWLSFYLMSRDMEMSCDEKVLSQSGGIKKAYSMALLLFAVRERFPLASPLAFGETGVKGRIKNALSFKKPKAWITVLAAVLCIAAVAACAADPKEEKAQYDDIESYVMSVISTETVEYPSVDGTFKTAKTADVRLEYLEKQGELSMFGTDGTLEAWQYEWRVRIDVPKEDVALVGGMSEADGWYDLEGQGGHILIVRRHEDGSYEVLGDEPLGDGADFYGMHESTEEALYDWYVKKNGLDLPLYVMTKDVKTANGNTQTEAFRRYTGDGWYVYIPAQSWRIEASDSDGAQFVSLYNTGSRLEIRKVTLSQEPEHPNEKYVLGREVRTVRDADGGAWIVRGTYDPETISELSGEYNSVALEPELIRIMADSFTASESFKRKPPETAEEALSEAMSLVSDKSVPVSLWLENKEGTETAAYSGRGVQNETQLSTSLSDFEYTESYVYVTDAPEGVMAACGGYRMKFAEGKNSLVLTAPEGKTYAFDAKYKYDSHADLGTLMRTWYDEAEFKAYGGTYDEQYKIIVPDRGQSHLQAAEEFCRIFESRHTEVSDGSQFKYTFVKCDVTEAEEETEHFRSLGRLSDDAWAFYLTVAFVPENERALMQSMAGNTGEYTGSDPDVPRGAFSYGRCGYVTRASDGWHAELVGTGW
ncbi:MAG: hypothetical protein IIY69_05735 [Clostridia bacterium]|nr:hypothetical protein [Clostridia bacterium]